MKFSTQLLVAIVATAASHAQAAPAPIDCIAMLDAVSGKKLVHAGRCDQAVTPASTFKIAE